jgi:lipoprotein-anchoring transpeptidase ErfK/SrfK
MTLRRHLSVLFAVTFTTVGLAVPGALAAEPVEAGWSVAGFGSLVPLDPGDTGPDVERLQGALTAAGFYHSEITGEYDRRTSSAVLALHKYLGLPRNSSMTGLDWIRLQDLAAPGIPDRWDEPDRVEVDLTRQVMFVIRNQEITGVLPVSTGGGYTYLSVRSGRTVGAHTPRGDFHLQWRQWGWSCDSVTGWCVYNYWSFSTFYGIHGYHEVPAYPASHGCTRVNTWDSDWLDSQLFIGMPVHIWDVPPVIPPEPHPPFDIVS